MDNIKFIDNELSFLGKKRHYEKNPISIFKNINILETCHTYFKINLKLNEIILNQKQKNILYLNYRQNKNISIDCLNLKELELVNIPNNNKKNILNKNRLIKSNIYNYKKNIDVLDLITVNNFFEKNNHNKIVHIHKYSYKN